jgi:hypothetical protein
MERHIMVRSTKPFHIIIAVLLLAWYALFLIRPIDLTTADLGRHIKNGQMVLQGNFGVLNTNFYSYTHPDFPVLNHHWGSGVIFYLINSMAGFYGLSLFFIVVSLVTFWIFFRLSWKESGIEIAAPVSLLLIPLIAERAEIRPEVFSYLFCAVFLWLLWHHRSGALAFKWLFILPLIQILWVNCHIYFILGPALIGVFSVSELAMPSGSTRKKAKELLAILAAVILATLINPFGLKGLLSPFRIFENYSYRIVENQSVRFLDKLGFISNPNLLLFKIAFSVLILSFILLWIRDRRSFSFVYFCSGAALSIMAWLAIRNFTLFGLFALPIISYHLKQGLPAKIEWNPLITNAAIIFLSVIIFSATLYSHHQRLFFPDKFAPGLMPGVNGSADFFIRENLRGPILNNYDIGGYLIYHLYPKEKVFTDNRPEAYPGSFFTDVYVPIQENSSTLYQQDKAYHFNAIFFSHRDATPWGQNFLIERISDPRWAPVYADRYAIIFLRRNNINRSIIDKYEIPRDFFRVVRPQ